MNKYKETLNNIRFYCGHANCDGYLNPKIFEELNIVQEFVDDKQTSKKEKPKKVDKKTKGIFPNNDTYLSYHTTYECPNCNCKLHLDWHEKRNYCPECGQKLDWSDTNEQMLCKK